MVSPDISEVSVVSRKKQVAGGLSLALPNAEICMVSPDLDSPDLD